MQVRNYIHIIFTFVLIVSCTSEKVLFKDIPENISIKVPEAVITYGDLIDVKISSLTNQSTSIFSPIAMDKIGTIRDAEARKLDAYLVDSSGNIDIPYIGKIKAYGLTCSSLSDSIKNKLLEFVKTPSVSTKILNFRVSILGQVASPGTFNVIDQNMSFTELITRAVSYTHLTLPTTPYV